MMSFNMGSQVRHMQKDKYLQVSMDHTHLVTVKHRLQNLLDAVAADRGQRSTPAHPKSVKKNKEQRRGGVWTGLCTAGVSPTWHQLHYNILWLQYLQTVLHLSPCGKQTGQVRCAGDVTVGCVPYRPLFII